MMNGKKFGPGKPVIMFGSVPPKPTANVVKESE